MRRSRISAFIDRIAYYEWAYGRLAESDSDIGPVGEFLVGKVLGCLPKSRKTNSRYDLVLPDGRGVEVKTTTHRVAQQHGKIFDYQWYVYTQVSSGNPLAPVWVFLSCDFPEAAAATPRFDVFDPRYWTARVATGQQIKDSGVKRYVSVSTLDRLGVRPVPLKSLKV